MAELDGYRSMGKVPMYSAKVNGDYSFNMYGEYEEIACKKPKTSSSSTCYVIVTCRSMAWSLLTIASTAIIIAGIITPQWLVGKPRWVGMHRDILNNTVIDPRETTYYPTIGLFNRCTKVHQFGGIKSDSCATYITGFNMSSDDFPDTWKSALILFSIAVVLLGFTNITAVFSLCIQAIFKKSIFTVSGLIQSLAALFLIVGMVLYPAGWGAQRVKDLCGDKAGAFLIEDCQIGWAYFACMGGTALLFVCALLSIQAEYSTSSDKVESKIMEGKSCICIL